jgi:hypothetical protein
VLLRAWHATCEDSMSESIVPSVNSSRADDPPERQRRWGLDLRPRPNGVAKDLGFDVLTTQRKGGRMSQRRQTEASFW